MEKTYLRILSEDWKIAELPKDEPEVRPVFLCIIHVYIRGSTFWKGGGRTSQIFKASLSNSSNSLPVQAGETQKGGMKDLALTNVRRLFLQTRKENTL